MLLSHLRADGEIDHVGRTIRTFVKEMVVRMAIQKESIVYQLVK